MVLPKTRGLDANFDWTCDLLLYNQQWGCGGYSESRQALSCSDLI